MCEFCRLIPVYRKQLLREEILLVTYATGFGVGWGWIETLRLRFFAFRANRERQEVTWPGPCRQVYGLRFTFVRLDHAPEVSDLPQGFLHPKTPQSQVWEEIRLFRIFLLIDYNRIHAFKRRNFEDNFSAKIELRWWMKTNMAVASYHPRIR